MKLSDKTIDYIAKSIFVILFLATLSAIVVCQAAPFILTACVLGIGECPIR